MFANQNVNTRSFKFGRGKDVGQRTNMSYMFQSVLQELKSEYPYVGLSFRAGWFARPEHLKNHMIIHSEDKPFSCNICEKSFRDSGTLVRHKKIHNSLRPFSCEFCTRTFVQGSNFRKHQMLFKDKEHLSCTKCAKTFTEAAKFKKHENIHLSWLSCTWWYNDNVHSAVHKVW